MTLKSKYKCNTFFLYNKLTFESVFSKNKHKLIDKFLKKLVNKLYHLQYSLNPEIDND